MAAVCHRLLPGIDLVLSDIDIVTQRKPGQLATERSGAF